MTTPLHQPLQSPRHHHSISHITTPTNHPSATPHPHSQTIASSQTKFTPISPSHQQRLASIPMNTTPGAPFVRAGDMALITHLETLIAHECPAPDPYLLLARLYGSQEKPTSFSLDHGTDQHTSNSSRAQEMLRLCLHRFPHAQEQVNQTRMQISMQQHQLATNALKPQSQFLQQIQYLQRQDQFKQDSPSSHTRTRSTLMANSFESNGGSIPSLPYGNLDYQKVQRVRDAYELDKLPSPKKKKKKKSSPKHPKENNTKSSLSTSASNASLPTAVEEKTSITLMDSQGINPTLQKAFSEQGTAQNTTSTADLSVYSQSLPTLPIINSPTKQQPQIPLPLPMSPNAPPPPMLAFPSPGTVGRLNKVTVDPYEEKQFGKSKYRLPISTRKGMKPDQQPSAAFAPPVARAQPRDLQPIGSGGSTGTQSARVFTKSHPTSTPTSPPMLSPLSARSPPTSKKPAANPVRTFKPILYLQAPSNEATTTSTSLNQLQGPAPSSSTSSDLSQRDLQVNLPTLLDMLYEYQEQGVTNSHVHEMMHELKRISPKKHEEIKNSWSGPPLSSDSNEAKQVMTKADDSHRESDVSSTVATIVPSFTTIQPMARKPSSYGSPKQQPIRQPSIPRQSSQASLATHSPSQQVSSVSPSNQHNTSPPVASNSPARTSSMSKLSYAQVASASTVHPAQRMAPTYVPIGQPGRTQPQPSFVQPNEPEEDFQIRAPVRPPPPVVHEDSPDVNQLQTQFPSLGLNGNGAHHQPSQLHQPSVLPSFVPPPPALYDAALDLSIDFNLQLNAPQSPRTPPIQTTPTPSSTISTPSSRLPPSASKMSYRSTPQPRSTIPAAGDHEDRPHAVASSVSTDSIPRPQLESKQSMTHSPIRITSGRDSSNPSDKLNSTTDASPPPRQIEAISPNLIQPDPLHLSPTVDRPNSLRTSSASVGRSPSLKHVSDTKENRSNSPKTPTESPIKPKGSSARSSVRTSGHLRQSLTTHLSPNATTASNSNSLSISNSQRQSLQRPKSTARKSSIGSNAQTPSPTLSVQPVESQPTHSRQLSSVEQNDLARKSELQFRLDEEHARMQVELSLGDRDRRKREKLLDDDANDAADELPSARRSSTKNMSPIVKASLEAEKIRAAAEAQAAQARAVAEAKLRATAAAQLEAEKQKQQALEAKAKAIQAQNEAEKAKALAAATAAAAKEKSKPPAVKPTVGTTASSADKPTTDRLKSTNPPSAPVTTSTDKPTIDRLTSNSKPTAIRQPTTTKKSFELGVGSTTPTSVSVANSRRQTAARKSGGLDVIEALQANSNSKATSSPARSPRQTIVGPIDVPNLNKRSSLRSSLKMGESLNVTPTTSNMTNKRASYRSSYGSEKTQNLAAALINAEDEKEKKERAAALAALTEKERKEKAAADKAKAQAEKQAADKAKALATLAAAKEKIRKEKEEKDKIAKKEKEEKERLAKKEKEEKDRLAKKEKEEKDRLAREKEAAAALAKKLEKEREAAAVKKAELDAEAAKAAAKLATQRAEALFQKEKEQVAKAQAAKTEDSTTPKVIKRKGTAAAAAATTATPVPLPPPVTAIKEKEVEKVKEKVKNKDHEPFPSPSSKQLQITPTTDSASSSEAPTPSNAATTSALNSPTAVSAATSSSTGGDPENIFLRYDSKDITGLGKNDLSIIFNHYAEIEKQHKGLKQVPDALPQNSSTLLLFATHVCDSIMNMFRVGLRLKEGNKMSVKQMEEMVTKERVYMLPGTTDDPIKNTKFMVKAIMDAMDLGKTKKLSKTAFCLQWNGFATRWFKIREDGPLDCAIM